MSSSSSNSNNSNSSSSASSGPSPLMPASVDPVTGKVMESPELRMQGLAEMRRLMSKSSQKFPRSDDKFLLAFLRSRKYKIADAFEVLLNFSKFWENPKYRHLIDGTNPEGLREFYAGGMSHILPGRDAEGNSIVMLYAGRMSAAKLFFDSTIRMALLFLAYVLENEDVQLPGITYVESFRGFSFGAAMGLRNVLSGDQQTEMRNIFLGTFPMRIRHIYVLYQPWYFSVVWAIARLFFSRKIVGRVRLLGSDLAALHALVPRDALPVGDEFGGTQTISQDDFIQTCIASGSSYGGFRVPFSVDAPAPPTAPAGVEMPPSSSSSSSPALALTEPLPPVLSLAAFVGSPAPSTPLVAASEAASSVEETLLTQSGTTSTIATESATDTASGNSSVITSTVASPPPPPAEETAVALPSTTAQVEAAAASKDLEPSGVHPVSNSSSAAPASTSEITELAESAFSIE